jgi:xylulokinase
VTRILTADFGTTATKAALWTEQGMVAMAAAPLATQHPEPGWAEQEPAAWWRSLRDAVDQLPDPGPLDAIGLCGARETFLPVTGDLVPLGPGLLWSDRRAVEEARVLTTRLGGDEALRQRIGLIIDAGAMVAKVAWLISHEQDRIAGARWLLSPRDWIGARLTGRVATDPTMASKTGFFTVDGTPLRELASIAGTQLPPTVPSDSVLGALLDGPATELGLRPGTPVVPGAGDRACEVIGADASPERPMVSWGTTANVSVPVAKLADRLPPGLLVTKGARHGWLFEAGLSASGAALGWLAAICGTTSDDLATGAARSAPGARGVIALPWLNGSRAPWWRPGARGGFAGLTAAHDRDDLARAIIEGVALDVDRSLHTVAPDARALHAVGGGSGGALWRQILAGVTGRPVVVRALPDAASAGACLLAAAAVGKPLNVDTVNPVDREEQPDPALVEAYAAQRALADRVAGAVVALDFED